MTDTKQFSDAIGLLYDCILEPARWTEALGALSGFVGGSSALLFHQDHRQQTGAFLQSYNADPHWTQLYFQKYVGLNPVLPLTTFMDAGSCSSFSRLIDMDEFKASQFYVEWAAPQQYLDVVVTILDKSASAMGMFGVTRLDHEGLAGDAEIQRMELVAPHVRRAVTMARLFDGVRGWARGMKDTIEILSDAVFLLDAAGKVVFANRAARDLAAAETHVSIAGSLLAFRDQATTLRLRDTLRGDRASRDSRSIPRHPAKSPRSPAQDAERSRRRPIRIGARRPPIQTRSANACQPTSHRRRLHRS